MFDRFTELARKTMSFARGEAERFNHDYIGTEHILLGLMSHDTGVAFAVLEELGVDRHQVRLEVEKRVKPNPDNVTVGQLPFTLRAKKVLEFSIGEARLLKDNYVSTEHLLLGLVHEQDSLAVHVLSELGLKLEEVRAEVYRQRGVDPNKAKDPIPAPLPGIFGRTFQIAKNEMRSTGSIKFGSEHILLALLSDPQGLAAKLLKNHGLELDPVRAEAVKMRLESPDSN